MSLGRRDAGVVVGVLGCMAERLQQQLLSKERSVDLVVGPDAYRDLPRLLSSLSVSSVFFTCIPAWSCSRCMYPSFKFQDGQASVCHLSLHRFQRHMSQLDTLIFIPHCH